MTNLESFRPLAGIMVLILPEPVLSDNRQAGVSVPLRGLWFLSAASAGRTVELEHAFPSPCGDYGSYRRRIRR